MHLDGGTLGVTTITHDSNATGTIYFNGGLLLNTYASNQGFVNGSEQLISTPTSKLAAP